MTILDALRDPALFGAAFPGDSRDAWRAFLAAVYALPMTEDQLAETVVSEFAALLTSYRVSEVSGDRYAGLWPAERFAAHGIHYQPAEKTKSEIYGAFLPLLNSGRVEILDLPRISSQLLGLERRTSRGRRDSFDHAPGGHDDVANAVAGALVMAAQQSGGYICAVNLAATSQRTPLGGDLTYEEEARQWERAVDQDLMGWRR